MSHVRNSRLPSQESILSVGPPVVVDYGWWFGHDDDDSYDPNEITKREMLERLFDGDKITTFFDGIVFLLRFLLFILLLTKACLILTLLIQGRLLIVVQSSTSTDSAIVFSQVSLQETKPTLTLIARSHENDEFDEEQEQVELSTAFYAEKSLVLSRRKKRNDLLSKKNARSNDATSSLAATTVEESPNNGSHEYQYDYVTGILLPFGYMTMTLLFAFLIPVPDTPLRTHFILVLIIVSTSVYEVISNDYSPLFTKNSNKSSPRSPSSSSSDNKVMITPALDLPSFSLAVFSMCYMLCLVFSSFKTCCSSQPRLFNNNPSNGNNNISKDEVVMV